MSVERREQLPRWLSTFGIWLIVLLLGIVGRLIWNDREVALATLNKTIQIIQQHEIRISILENNKRTDRESKYE